jgi:hypothetical protein
LRVTKKQILLLIAIRKGGELGEFPDIDQVLLNLDYETSKASIQFSIRALIKNNWVAKQELEPRRGQHRRVLSLTQEGYRIAEVHSKTQSADVE